MFEKNDKRRIYELIEMYLQGKIDAWNFCNEFYVSYDLEVDSNTLTALEEQTFSELSSISSRYTKFEKDLINYPDVYSSEAELKKKIIETKDKLSRYGKINNDN